MHSRLHSWLTTKHSNQRNRLKSAMISAILYCSTYLCRSILVRNVKLELRIKRRAVRQSVVNSQFIDIVRVPRYSCSQEMFLQFSKVVCLLSFTLLKSVLAGKVPTVEYDIIVIGGGPAGLSAASALSRVNRRVIVFDDEIYRNAKTRNMHDVIGNDGYSSPHLSYHVLLMPDRNHCEGLPRCSPPSDPQIRHHRFQEGNDYRNHDREIPRGS